MTNYLKNNYTFDKKKKRFTYFCVKGIYYLKNKRMFLKVIPRKKLEKRLNEIKLKSPKIYF
jgi:hypothetical protein